MAKNYIRGWAKQITTKFGPILKLMLNIEDLNALPKTEKWYIKLVVAQRKEVWQYGDTHSVYEDDYVPNQNGENGGTSNSQEDSSEELPF